MRPDLAARLRLADQPRPARRDRPGRPGLRGPRGPGRAPATPCSGAGGTCAPAACSPRRRGGAGSRRWCRRRKELPDGCVRGHDPAGQAVQLDGPRPGRPADRRRPRRGVHRQRRRRGRWAWPTATACGCARPPAPSTGGPAVAAARAQPAGPLARGQRAGGRRPDAPRAGAPRSPTTPRSSPSNRSPPRLTPTPAGVGPRSSCGSGRRATDSARKSPCRPDAGRGDPAHRVGRPPARRS